MLFCAPAHYRYGRMPCGAGPCDGLAFLGRASMLLVALTVGPSLLGGLLMLFFVVAAFLFKVALFTAFVFALSSLFDSAFAAVSCSDFETAACPCPMTWMRKMMCPSGTDPRPCGPNQCGMAAKREAKCGAPTKRAEPPPAPTQHKVDLSASAEAYPLAVNVPGIAQDDLRVSAQPWSARSGEAPSVTIDGATNGIKVHRAVRLPKDAQTEQATVKYANGQLTMLVPKVKTRALTIAVTAAPAPTAASGPAAAAPPVVREATPHASNVQQPEESCSEEEMEAKDEWEPVAVEQ